MTMTMESESTGPSWAFVQTLTHEGASFHVYMWAPLHTPSSKYHTYIYRKEGSSPRERASREKAHGMTQIIRFVLARRSYRGYGPTHLARC